jgi:hypothetical protein
MIQKYKKTRHKVLSNINVPKSFICSICQDEFESRKDLYSHRMLQHGAGDTSALWELPFQNGPWVKYI